MIRSSGILLPIFSLPNNECIGTLGKEAYDFIDYLCSTGFTYWQILPTGPTGYSNSPYQPLSSFAGNPYLISLDALVEEGYLFQDELTLPQTNFVDYATLYQSKLPLLKLAASRIPLLHPSDYFTFLQEEKWWLKDYAAFMAIKDYFQNSAFQDWLLPYRNHNSAEVKELSLQLTNEISTYMRIQYFFYHQFSKLKTYADTKSIQLITDLPFYAAIDSADVWSNPELFELNDQYQSILTAGMPGQSWGNPLYKWDKHRSDNYAWWTKRIHHQFRFSSILRLDHYRGMLEYYAIDKDNHGTYHKGPQNKILTTYTNTYGKHNFILEDLGELTDDFKQLVYDSGYPGMRILQYAFDENDPGSYYMPFQYDTRNAVVYTGTHDNETLLQWIDQYPSKANRASKYLNANLEDLDISMMKCALGTTCDLVIFQAQDVLRLIGDTRINQPGESKDQWIFRLDDIPETNEYWKDNLKLFCRYNWDTGKL